MERQAWPLVREFGLNELGELPDIAGFDPSAEFEQELRDRLLRAGEARAGIAGVAAPGGEGVTVVSEDGADQAEYGRDEAEHYGDEAEDCGDVAEHRRDEAEDGGDEAADSQAEDVAPVASEDTEPAGTTSGRLPPLEVR